jgi:hypothetical protein
MFIINWALSDPSSHAFQYSHITLTSRRSCIKEILIKSLLHAYTTRTSNLVFFYIPIPVTLLPFISFTPSIAIDSWSFNWRRKILVFLCMPSKHYLLQHLNPSQRLALLVNGQVQNLQVPHCTVRWTGGRLRGDIPRCTVPRIQELLVLSYNSQTLHHVFTESILCD